MHAHLIQDNGNISSTQRNRSTASGRPNLWL